MKNRLTIAIQKGGRLSDQSKDLIKKSGINFSTKGDKLLAKSNNLPIDILFFIINPFKYFLITFIRLIC